jgi:hypothetical protein
MPNELLSQIVLSPIGITSKRIPWRKEFVLAFGTRCQRGNFIHICEDFEGALGHGEGYGP